MWKYLRSDLCFSVLCSLAFLAVAFPFATLGIDCHHDGIMLKPAVDVSKGAVLFRDSFTQYGPATTLLHAAMLKVFGTELRVIRFGGVAAYTLTVFFSCLFWRSFLPKPLVVAAVGWICVSAYFFRVGWALQPWSSGLALCAQSLSLFLLGAAYQQKRFAGQVGAVASAGAIVSLVFWFRQPVGALLSVSALGVPLSLQWERLVNQKMPVSLGSLVIRNSFLWGYVAGGCAVAAGFLGWMWWSDCINEWYVQNVLWPRKFGASYLSLMHLYQCFFSSQVLIPIVFLAGILSGLKWWSGCYHWWCMFTLGLLLAWLVVCFVHPRVFTVIIFNKMIPAGCLLLMGARILDRNSVQVPWAKFALAIAALSAWGQFYPIACIRHTFWGVVPMIGMFMYFLWDRFRIDSRLMLGCLAIFVFPLALVRFAEARDHLRLAEDAWSVPGPLYGMRPYRSKDLPHYATKSDCEGFEMLRRCVVDNGGTREVTLYGVDAMLALITDNHLNPGPFHVTWTGLSEFGCFEDRERVMAERSPLLAVQGQWLGGEGLGQFQSRGYRVLCRVFAFGSDVYLLGR